MKTIPLVLTLLAVTTLGPRAGAARPAAAARPNIVFILADDMGCGDVSAYNPSSAWRTPNLDALARDGMRFTDAHSSSAVCTPSRYAILTGRYNWRSARKSGVGDGLSPALIEPGRLTVASFLREHGYATAMIGKWHLGLDWARDTATPAPQTSDPADGERRGALPAGPAAAINFARPFGGGPIACGFDSFLGISASLDMPPYAWLHNDRVDSLQPLQPIAGSKAPAMWRAGLAAEGFAHVDALPREAGEAVEYLKGQRREKPFFLFLSLTAPHTPIVPAADFAGRTRATVYGDFCVQVDDVVGQVLAALKTRGLDQDTIVIFTADNGCSPAAGFEALKACGHDPQAGRRGAKADIYEGGHRVPFLVCWPGRVPAGRVNDGLMYQGDWLATCAELMAEKLPDNAGEDSVSLLPSLVGGEPARPLHEALVHHSINGSFAIRQGPWKLCLCPDSGGWSEPKPGKAPAASAPFQLFNLERDPAERTNVYAEHPEIARRLGLLLREYVLRGRSTPGAEQRNTGGNDWPQLAWMREFVP